ncbi:uncharacterized protein LAESUDRAFT_719857 [Laetiporus sulphureus 93-53]|uniref:Uncharacterized protein n=1 Tax=Laetiporus sulphureus 93-53 TaxID=1314785 RepID=A0A165HM50_9APHY|nr:uncharacterized protein LAESUDRAFT_719857 [Laetiporus sulphureus 93-53]KZT11915.1 hypothetical protein LAESUDRAFT_719857 [Laetiporus sulphureus 93-53]
MSPDDSTPSSSTSRPITILQHPALDGSSSSSFLNWRNDAENNSFLPSLVSPSSSFDSDSPLSPLEPASPSLTPTLTWETAAADAAAGVHYVMETFPVPGSMVGPPFRNEPIQVNTGARVVVLDEVGDHALRVRALDTDNVGLLPRWNVEGALERLARLNMEFNEAATCPAERSLYRRSSGKDSNISARDEQALAHSHDRCIPFSERLPFYSVDDYDYDDGGGEDLYERSMYAAEPKVQRPRKSVGFAQVERPIVFRYPSQALVEAYYGTAEEQEELGSDEEGEKEWWWAGWEEHQDAVNPDDWSKNRLLDQLKSG